MSYVYIPIRARLWENPTIRNFGMAPGDAIIRQCFPGTT